MGMLFLFISFVLSEFLLIPGAPCQDPFSICNSSGCSLAMATAENLPTLIQLLKNNGYPSAAVAGWNNQAANLVLRDNGALAPYKRFTNDANAAICVKNEPTCANPCPPAPQPIPQPCPPVIIPVPRPCPPAPQPTPQPCPPVIIPVPEPCPPAPQPIPQPCPPVIQCAPPQFEQINIIHEDSDSDSDHGYHHKTTENVVNHCAPSQYNQIYRRHEDSDSEHENDNKHKYYC